MIQPQTGEEQMQNYSVALSKQLQRTAEQFGLDTAETEELTQWGSTATVTLSQSISEVLTTLMNGWKDLNLITNKPGLEDQVLADLIQSRSNVRYAVVIRRPKKPVSVIAYLGR